MASKLRLKYEVDKNCPAFFVGSNFQISKDGEHLLCDNISNIAVVDVSTGQAAKKNPNVTETFENKDFVSLPENDDEDEGPEDAFKNARIEMDEADGVTSFKLSPDGTKLIIATKTLLLKLYSWPDRTLIKQFRSYHRAHITCLDWDLSSTIVVSGSADQTARVWDTRRSCSTHSLRDTVGVFGCVTFHSNLQEHPYVYAGVMTVLCAWKLSAGSSELVHKFDSAHFMNITCIEVTRDGKHLVSCGLDRIVILWNAAPMEQVKVVMVGQAVGAAVVLPRTDETEGVSVLLGGETGNLSIWRVDSGKEVLRTPKPLVEPIPGDERGSLCITGMMLCPALKSVVVSSYDNNLLFVHTEHLKLWKMFCGYNEQVLATIFVTSVPAKKKKEKKEKCNVDGGDHSFLVVATNSSQLRLYRLSDMSCRLLHGHTDGVMALAKHPHLTDVFASSSRDESVRVWRVTDDFDAVCVAVASGHTHRVAAIALGMDILISGSKDTCIKRWLINEEKLTVIKKELLEEAKKKRSKDAAIKQELISSADAMVPNSLVCAATQVGHEKDINCICVAPKDKLVATASEDRTIKVWSGDRLSLEGTLRGHKRGVWSVQFSPVDKLLVSSSADGTLAIWLLESMTLAKTLSGHECGVLNVSWLNRGLQLVSTSASGIVKIWEVKTSTCLDSLSAHDEQRVWAVDVSHDGEKIVTGGEDSKIIVWRDVTQTVLAKQAEEKQRIESEQQTLANLMREQRWAEALVFTLKLDQPFNSLKVIKGLLRSSGRVGLGQVLGSLEPHHLGALIKFACKWNTRAATCTYAQEILYLLLSTRTPEELDEIPFWSSSLAAFSSYSSRHYSRAASLHQSACVINYCASLVSMTRAVQAIDITDRLGSEDEEDIDDMAILNFLRPIKEEKPEAKNDSSSDSSESEEERDDAIGSTLDNSDVSMASDDEGTNETQIKKKKKKSKAAHVEDLDAGYVQEAPVHSEEEDNANDNGNDSWDDEGVASEEGFESDDDKEEYNRSDEDGSFGSSRSFRGSALHRGGSDRDSQFSNRGRGFGDDRGFRGGFGGRSRGRGGLSDGRGRGGFGGGRGRGGFGGDRGRDKFCGERGRGGFGGGRGRGGFGGNRGRGGFGGDRGRYSRGFGSDRGRGFQRGRGRGSSRPTLSLF